VWFGWNAGLPLCAGAGKMRERKRSVVEGAASALVSEITHARAFLRVLRSTEKSVARITLARLY